VPRDLDQPDLETIRSDVRRALAEDVGPGDASASLIAADRSAQARIICRENGVLAGRAWADEAFAACDPAIELSWAAQDGDDLEAGQALVTLSGPARGILTGERTALNFLQLLSAVATRTQAFVSAVAGTGARILDTRKTLPGLRLAQKYAVRCGGGSNHRIGLFDLIMLKENHIAAAGGIAGAVATARDRHPELAVEVEVENLDEYQQALEAGADRILLDNFPLAHLRQAVVSKTGSAVLEASGGITLETVAKVAATGVDDISIGELTKRITPLDLSLRFID
jgi:nicotinate-nucleotide pyrophosphorylase (carboxylating)